jgi:hypothetical protein
VGTLMRADNDWYQDQPEDAEALPRAERFSGLSWDPCCGVGTIPRVLRDAGFGCVGTDLVYRGYKCQSEYAAPAPRRYESAP